MHKTLVLASLCLVMACEQTAAPEAPIIRPVRSVVVTDSTASAPTRVFSGVSRAGEESKLSFRVGGSLQILNVKLGDAIKKGHEIGRLDASDLELKAQQASDSLAEGRANQRRATSEFDRMRQLYESSTASRSQYDQARNSLDQAKAMVRSAQKQVTLARKQVGYAKLNAPTDGVVSKVMVEPGENIGMGQTVIVLASGGAPEVVVNVAGTFIAQVKVGDTVKVRFQDIKDKTYQATVREIGITPEEKQTTFPVIAALTTHDEDVRLGMGAEVEFEAKERADLDGIYVPSTAIAEDTGGRYVFKVEAVADGLATVRKQPVKAADQLTERGIRVTEGVVNGDRVVTAGVSRVIDGQKVRVLEGGE